MKKNPRVKLPVKWTTAKVRVNSKGQVQVKIDRSKVVQNNPYAVKTWQGTSGPFSTKKSASEYAKSLRDANRFAGNRGSVKVVKINPNVLRPVKRNSARKRNPRNGYVVHPGNDVHYSLSAANKDAKRESADRGHARVENADTGKTMSTWRNGRRQ